uniref:glycosyltransferase n=1 Tax=Parabacteroides sp. AM08-6 TaxID=2292053 RepID=UPI000EFE388E
YWNKVTFTGRLNKDELYEFYQIADIGVMPSLHEQCSYVAMEMLMFNIPLLISTSTGLNETLEGVEKIEVEEREDDVYISVEKMAESMLALLQAPPSNMYRETYLRKYEESLFLEKMRNLYESLFV